jgi:hypothetical protein
LRGRQTYRFHGGYDYYGFQTEVELSAWPRCAAVGASDI